MKRCSANFAVALLGAIVSGEAMAQESAGERSAYGAGDLVMIAVDMPVFHGIDSEDTFYAPGYSTFWIDSKREVDGKPAWVVHFRCIPANQGRALIGCGKKRGARNPETLSGNETVAIVKQYTAYVVKEDDLELYAPRTFGTEYGVLIAPYKFHLDDNSLSGEATLGGYVGYRLASPGIAITPVVAAGVGVVSATTDGQEGQGEESNHASLTVAAGVITTLSRQGTFQFGLLIGWDWTGKDSGYEHEGKPWIALSFGTRLTQ